MLPARAARGEGRSRAQLSGNRKRRIRGGGGITSRGVGRRNQEGRGMRQRLEEALRDSGADYADIRIERAESTSLNFRGPELDSISSASSLGGVARALVRGGWGVVTFNDISELRRSVAEAVACARLVGTERSQLAEVEPATRIVPPPPMERDFRGVPLSEKRLVAQSYNEIMLKHHPKIQTTTTSYR